MKSDTFCNTMHESTSRKLQVCLLLPITVFSVILFVVTYMSSDFDQVEKKQQLQPSARDADVIELNAAGECHQYVKYMHGMAHLPNCKYCKK